MTAGTATLVCVGNAALDRIWRVATLPKPGQKMRSLAYQETGGGQAANAAVAATRLGGRVRLVSVVGSDTAAAAIRDGLLAEGVDVSRLTTVAGARSIVSAVLVENGGERIVVGDVDPALHATIPTPGPGLLEGAGAVLADVKWPNAAAPILAEARRRGIPTVLDIEPATADNHQRLVPLADHALFSQAGLAAFTGTDDPETGLDRAFAGLGRVVGVTLGAAGMRLRGPDGAASFPAPAISVVDTTGAGDAFHGAYALAIAEGCGMSAAARLACAVAALKCTKPGGRDGLPTRAAAEALLRRA